MPASWPFDALNANSTYAYNSSVIEFTGGVVRLASADQTDDDNSSLGFGGGTLSGSALWDGANSALRLGTATPNLEHDSSWTPAWSSLVSYWKLNEPVGSGSAVDSIGTNALTPSNITFGNAGKIGGSATFNGTNSYLASPSINLGGAFTYAVWAKITGSTGTIQSLLANSVGGNTIDGIRIFINSLGTDDGSISIETGNGTATFSTLAPTGAFQSGSWQHLAFVVNRTAGIGKIYLNGDEVASGNVRTDFKNTAVYRLGTFTNTTYPFNGQMDEAALWNTALSPSAIQAIYRHQAARYSGTLTSRVMDALSTGQPWTSLAWRPTLPFFKALPDSAINETISSYSSLYSDTLLNGLIGLWHLDEPAGTNGAGSISDRSAFATPSNGTPSNVTFGSAGMLGTSAKFNSSNSSNIALGSNLVDTLDGTHLFTVSAWALMNQLPGTVDWTNQKHIINIGETAALIADYTQRWCVYIFGANSSFYNVCSPNGFRTNEWHQIVGTYDGSALSLYVDGQLSASSSVTTDTQRNNSSTYIGASLSPDRFFDGSIDEIAVWNRPLNSNEILQLYRRGANRILYQVRTCTDSTCTSGSPAWKGPDGTDQTFFSELYNTASNSLTGAVSNGLPSMTFSNFGSLSVSANRYFQYRAILETDDANSLCNYGSGPVPCSPELKSVTAGPPHYDKTSPTVVNQTGVNYSTVLSSISETLGANGCPAGVTYQLSKDGTNWKYWNSGWVSANATPNSAESNSSATIQSNLSTFASSVGTGSLYFRAFLNSSGAQACELDQLTITGN